MHVCVYVEVPPRWVGMRKGKEKRYEGGTTHLLIHLFVVYFIHLSILLRLSFNDKVTL